MSKFITELKESQNKALFSYLCENLGVKEYNKLNSAELKYVTDCFASFTKQGAIDLVANYMKNNLQNSYYSDSSLDELIVIKKMCEHHKIAFTDTPTPEYQLKITLFEYLGGWLEKFSMDVDNSHFAASQCTILFDDDLSFSKYVVEETFNVHDDDLEKSIQSLLILLTNKPSIKKQLYYKNITSCFGEKEKALLCEYYIKNYDDHFGDFFEIGENEFIGNYFKKPKNEIHFFCSLIKSNALDSNYSLSWHQGNEFKSKITNIKNWVAKNAVEINKKDKKALSGFTDILIKNSLASKSSLDLTDKNSGSIISFNLLTELLQDIQKIDQGVFNSIKKDVMASFSKLVQEKKVNASPLKSMSLDEFLILSEKLMLSLDLVGGPSVSQEIKSTHKV